MVCSLCAHWALHCYQGNYLASSLVSSALLWHYFFFFFNSAVVQCWISNVNERKKRTRGKRQADIWEIGVIRVMGGGQLSTKIWALTALPTNGPGECGFQQLSLQSGYGCGFGFLLFFLLFLNQEISPSPTHAHAHAPRVTSQCHWPVIVMRSCSFARWPLTS